MNSQIKDNLSIIRNRIANACKTSNRNPSEVKLLLATKTVPAEKILIALNEGEALIGENKVQELKEKHSGLASIAHNAHYIGHLQTNKIKEVLKYVNCIQSVDRMDLAEKLDQRLRQEGRTLDILLQVNTSYEESKFGIDPSEVVEFAKAVSQYDTLKVKGLMTIGLFSSDLGKVRVCFRLLKNISTKLQELQLPNFDLKELSMGMSNDLEVAIEEGATIVKVGTAIFGDRMYPDSYYWNEKMEIK